MPLLFLERFPWPSLRTYTALSALALAGTVLSAYRALRQASEEHLEVSPESQQPTAEEEEQLLAGEDRPSSGLGPSGVDVAYYLLSDSLCVWVSGPAQEGPGVRGKVASRGAENGCGGRQVWAESGGVGKFYFFACFTCTLLFSPKAGALVSWDGGVWRDVNGERAKNLGPESFWGETKQDARDFVELLEQVCEKNGRSRTFVN